MATYTHTLTEIETACGVTLEQVAAELPLGVFAANSSRFVVRNVAPALAQSVARCAFGGRPTEFAGIDELGHLVYRLA